MRRYWICFSTYVDTLISNADMPMEFFVEGTRARPGKSLHPKVGLLGVAVRPFLERRVGDILLIPISITYEQRMETHLYVQWMNPPPVFRFTEHPTWRRGAVVLP